MKVWIVIKSFEGEIREWSIERVFDSRKKANNWIDRVKKTGSYFDWEYKVMGVE